MRRNAATKEAWRQRQLPRPVRHHLYGIVPVIDEQYRRSSDGVVTRARHWIAVATRISSSGVMRWSWLSSPMSSWTQFTVPVKVLPALV